MANWFSDKSTTKVRVTISRFVQNKHFTEYEVVVQFTSAIYWKLMKRYSDFAKLYDELSETSNNFKVFFPPKKLFKTTSERFLNQRKRCLEAYMNEIISIINNYVPRPLAKFLEMEKYEIHGITTKLANTLFKHGEAMINNRRPFEISILSIYAINQRMLSPAPTNIYNLPGEDFGNVLEVIERSKKIKIIPYSVFIQGTESLCGTSNIKSETLLFDISIFSGAEMLELNSVEIKNLRGLYKMNTQVEVLEAHHCLKSLEDILFGDIVYLSSTVEDLMNFCGPWRCTKTIDFSNNSITFIDKSIVTLKQVSNLNLSHNQISEIDNLQYLTFLTELNLSYNNLVMCENVSFSHRLGSVKKLILKGNKLTKLILIDRMFSLEYLDISENNINEFKAFLPFCRLSCLEKLIIKNNPICSRECFLPVLFDIFLDQINSVKINEIGFSDIPTFPNDVSVRRQLKESILLDSINFQSHKENNGETRICKDSQNLLMSIDVDITNLSKKNSILNIPDVYNIIIYWFFPAVKRSVVPSKILWCTQICSPNQHTKPAPILLITCNTLNACILQCSVKISIHNSNTILTIRPLHFIDLNKNLRNLVIGADKLFVRFDMANEMRSLYLINNSHYIDSFMGHLYHIDDEIVKFGDSRLIYLNEEDRLESLRRFIDVWRYDMVTSLLRSGENRTINTDTDSEILFTSRAMLQNSNGFQILLTIVVTRQMLCLVDERIYDWPDLIKHPSVSDFTTLSNSSPQTSSSSQFQFLRINAYFFHQVKSCIKLPAPSENILSTWTPTFSHSLQILFNSNPKEPMYLHFENTQKTESACKIINQLCENEECCLLPVKPYSEPVNVPTEIPTSQKYVTSSFHEIRLSLSLFCPKLSSIAQSTLNEIVSFCHSKMQIPEESSKINGIIWTKFIYYQYESNDDACQIKQENPCLICLSANNIDIIYEIEESSLCDSEYWSDPESDQPDTNSIPTKLCTVSLDLNSVFKIYIGLYNQWITLCFRTNEQSSENRRLILIIRNYDLVKQFVSWLKLSFKNRSIEGKFSDILEYSHDNSNIDELLFQIRKTAKCEDIDLIHYASVEDVRIDPPSIIDICTDKVSNDSFTYAVVITNSNLSIIRHNVAEYPVRHFGQGAIRQSPKHLQYQILMVIPLYECVQLQLPGHDKNLLIIIIQSNHRNNTNSLFKIQLSVNCQKEQKNLIDKLRQQFTKCLQVDTPLRVIVS